MEKLVQRQTGWPEHVIQLSRYLRSKNFDIGPQEELDVLEVFSDSIPASFEEQQDIYRSIYVKNRKQYLLFDELYTQYWKELERAEDSKNKEVEEQGDQKKKQRPQMGDALNNLKNWLYNGRLDGTLETSTFSAFESIMKKDFSAFLHDDANELRRIIRIIAQRLANKKSRRFAPSQNPKSIDLRRTIREAQKRSADIHRFYFKKRQQKKVNVVLLCDVSRSMELYSKFLIDFMYNFQQAAMNLKTFVFSTQLIALSRLLREGDFEKVLSSLSDQVPYWSGGTRIGACFEDFNHRYGSRLLNSNTIVIVLSDGIDTGDISILEQSMKSIHKKSHRVIWLNPLAGNPDYEPTVAGMKACMPYIDVFTSAHNADSLKRVASHIRL